MLQLRRRISDAEAIAEDAVVRVDRDRKAALDRQVDSLADQVKACEIEIEVARRDTNVKERQLSELAKKLEGAARNRGKDDLAKTLIGQLREFGTLFKERKRHSLASQIHQGLKTLLHKRGFIHGVEVDMIGEDIEIHLLNARRQRIRKESLSKGEQQMYATALLHGLVEESEIEFPVFIDSPMQKFDEEHAQNIVKYFYPSIAKQVILFPLLHKELTAREYALLAPHVARTYLIENRGPDQSVFRAVPPEQLFETYEELYH